MLFLDGIPFPNFTLTVDFACRSHCDHDEHNFIAFSIGFWFYLGGTPTRLGKFCFPTENVIIEFSPRGRIFFINLLISQCVGTILIWAAGDSEHATMLTEDDSTTIIGLSMQMKKKVIINCK